MQKELLWCHLSMNLVLPFLVNFCLFCSFSIQGETCPPNMRSKYKMRGKTLKKWQKLQKWKALTDVHLYVQSRKSYGAHGKSVDYHVYGGRNASRNSHSISAEYISFNIPGHGWEDHPTVDTSPLSMTDTHQDQAFLGYETQVCNFHFVWFHVIFCHNELNDFLYLPRILVPL